MKELQRTDRLTIAIVLFLLIIIIGLITSKRPDMVYTRDLAASVEDVQHTETFIAPEDVQRLTEQGEANSVIIDIRNVYDFNRGHLPGSINIPKIDLLQEENIRILEDAVKDNKSVILYGNDQLEATGAGMLLRQLGFDNVRVMMGGYDYILSPDTGKAMAYPSYVVENPRYDFSEMASSSGPANTAAKEAEAPEVIVPRKKTKAKAEGGC